MELNKKLAKWAGFEWYDEPCSQVGCSGHCGWSWPGGKKIYTLGMQGLPHFTDSLDACFKWLVPKLHKEQGQVTIESRFKGDEDWEYWASFGCGRSGVFKAKTPALALCLAIEKLIENEIEEV